MPTDKEKYKLLCESSSYAIPIFQQYWWMETVCRDKCWDVILIEENNAVVAAFPYLLSHKGPFRYILQPQLTQYSGPIFFYPSSMNGDSARIAFENRISNKIIERIRNLHLHLFLQHFSPQITNWLPFYWNGFRQTTRYTYRLNDISNSESLFRNFDYKQRQKKILHFLHDTLPDFSMTPNEFAHLHHRYWKSRGKKDILTEDFIAHVCRQALSRQQGVIAALRDNDNHLLAARFVVFDQNCAFSLMSAQNPSSFRNGYSETLIWYLLQYLAPLTHSFDFEGSMDPGIEYFYRSFGAVQTPFFEISRCNLFLETLLRLKQR